MMRRGSRCPRRNGFGKLGRAANASGNGRPTSGTAKGGSRAEAGEALSGTNGQRSKGRWDQGGRGKGLGWRGTGQGQRGEGGQVSGRDDLDARDRRRRGMS
ncbi:hypothetical protein GCM10010149_86120 [Nonomuraea roseoviolacea subsp. roseoviolacea]